MPLPGLMVQEIVRRSFVYEPVTNRRSYQKGDIVRYGDGSTALMRLHSQSGGRWYGQQCMGGSCGMQPYCHADEEDIKMWWEVRREYKDILEWDDYCEAMRPR